MKIIEIPRFIMKGSEPEEILDASLNVSFMAETVTLTDIYLFDCIIRYLLDFTK